MARTDGSCSTVSQAPALQRVWQSMRVMRRFTSADLMATAEAGESAVQKYLRALAAAAYLRLVQERVSGRTGSRDTWQLVRDSGPLAPIRRRDGSGVYDPNTQQVWGLDGRLVAQPAPAPGPGPQHYPQAVREALRHLADHGTANASVDTLQALLRGGLVALQLTDAGRELLQHSPAPMTQREGAAFHSAEAAHDA